MARHDGMKEKKCGCTYFDYGPPVMCERHASKASKREAREKAREEKGLRKLVVEQAVSKGHDLSRFKEYPSRPGKWTAHCHNCGAIVIVYDVTPEFGDQVATSGILETCQRSALVGTLGDAEREAIAERFSSIGAEDNGTNDLRETGVE